MPLKKFYEFNGNESCNFCNFNKIDVLYGPVYKNKAKYDGRSLTVHYFCLLMASKIEQNGRDSQGILGFFPKDIIKELSRGKNQICCYCGKRGATVHCIHAGCNRIFHLPCGIENGSIHQFFHLFNSYCHLHKPKQSIPTSIIKNVDASCIICCDNINKYNKYSSLWPSCCKPRALLHRKCVQTLADNAGYYFKCPLCNNSELFKSEMQKIGIYIPEQEASWESEPHAYEELLVRGSGCESKDCCCPQGRKLNKANSSWQLELCKVCGGNGVHLGCTPRWNRTQGYQFNWFCEICKPVYLENNPSKTPERPVEEDNIALNVDENTSPAMDEDTNSTSDTIFVEEKKLEEDVTENTKPLIGTENSPLKIAPGTSSTPLSESNNGLSNAICKKDEPLVPEDDLNPTVPQDSSHDSSDDDCQIVGVTCVPRKRSANEYIPAIKRFRTARWIPPNISNAARVQHHAANTHQNVQLDQSLTVRVDGTTRLLQSQTQAQTAIDKMTQPIRTESQVNQSDRFKQSNPPCRESKNNVSNHQGPSRFSDVKLKLSEVSINRLPIKEAPPLINASAIFDCISIELSSDEELSDDTPKAPNPAISLPTKKKPLSQLQQLLTQNNLPENPFSGNADVNIHSWIKSQIDEAEQLSLLSHGNSTDKCSSNSEKKSVPMVTLQVVLSSDDEEETNSSLPVNTSHLTKSGRDPSKTLQSSSHNASNPILANSVKGVTPIQKKPSQNYSQIKSKDDESSSLNTGAVKKTTGQPNKSLSMTSFSILNVPLNGEDKLIRPEILIVSDDDSEDDIIVSAAAGDNKLPGNPIKESTDMVNNAIESDRAFLENPIRNFSEISSDQGSTSWVGIISGVTTLADVQFDMKEDEYVPVENETVIKETTSPNDACEFFSEEVVSSTVSSSDLNQESKLSSPTVSLCACVVSCSCKTDSSFKEPGNLVALVSVEESVSSTTNDDNHNNNTSS